MSHRPSSYRIVFPTADIVAEYRSSEQLLMQVDLDLKTMAVFVVDQWIQFEKTWGHPHHSADVSAHEIVFNYVHNDLLASADPRSLDREDRRAIVTVVHEFCNEIYRRVVPILEELELDDNQIQNLRFDKWIGDSMSVSTVGRHR